nr:uncharacterized protein LOC123497597 [Aegilops tauschii subsp. strangulata]
MDSADEFFFHNFMCDSGDSSSDDDEEMLVAVLVHDHLNRQRPLFRGSIPGHIPALNRNRESGHFLLWKDHFDTTNPLFKHQKFRCFNMARHLFNRIREGVVGYDNYFECKEDALGKIGFSSYQKCIAAIRMLAYGVSGYLIEEYVCMSEPTCLESMYRFCKVVIVVFGLEYWREPTAQDTTRLLAVNASRGFLGMLGGIDCMHCGSGRTSLLLGKGGVRAMSRVALSYLRLVEGNNPPVNVNINGYNYDKGYYLGDGIYPQWTTTVKTIPNPVREKRK